MDNYKQGKEMMDKYSLRGQVFNKIREDILSGNYAEREELKEAAISKALGVSRTPVREALRQLEKLRPSLVLADTVAENAASIRILTRLGFVRTAVHPGALCRAGRRLDIWDYALRLDRG